MRRAALLTGLGLALACGGAAAAAPSTAIPFTVTGNAPQVCAVQNPVLAPGALVNFQSLNGTTLQLSQLADPKTLAASAASATVTFAAVCNYPHLIVLESQNNGLYRDGAAGSPPPPGFADGVPYTATLTWGAVTSQFFVAATTRQTTQDRITVGQPTAGNIQILLTIQSGASNLSANSPLVAGVYSDTLRVTVEPQ
ncbi:MAG: hypothetical protein ACHP7N_02440 [Caulobacterales bacterium]